MVRCNFVSLFRVKHFLVLTCSRSVFGFVVAKREGFSFIFLRFLLHSQGCRPIAKCLQGSEFSFTGWLKLTLPQYISGVRHLKPVEFPPPPDRCSLVYSTIFSNYRAMLCIARRMLSQYVCPSVRPTVRHTPLLC